MEKVERIAQCGSEYNNNNNDLVTSTQNAHYFGQHSR